MPEYADSELSQLVSDVRRDARRAKDAHRDLGRSLARLDEYLSNLALFANLHPKEGE